MAKGITSVEGFVRKIFRSIDPPNKAVFYRGHSDRDKFKLKPSIFRNEGHMANEHLMFREIMITNTSDFHDDKSTFEKLVRMQHYFLNTRLLDLTSNPLMALYFACDSNPEKTGEVIKFSITNERVKFFDSDTVSCVANLAQLSDIDKAAININIEDKEEFNQQEPIRKLLHFIKEEKPYFRNSIVPSDLGRVICVKSKLTNTRIMSQSGSFLIFGHGAVMDEDGNDEFEIERISINADKKNKIMSELDTLAINNKTVYSSIENSAKYIAMKYKSA